MSSRILGAIMSHVKAWEMALKHFEENKSGPYDLICLFEDDARPYANYKKVLSDALQELPTDPAPIDVLYISPWNVDVGEKNTVWLSNKIFQSLSIFVLAGYCLTPSGARKLMNLLPVVAAVDIFVTQRQVLPLCASTEEFHPHCAAYSPQTPCRSPRDPIGPCKTALCPENTAYDERCVKIAPSAPCLSASSAENGNAPLDCWVHKTTRENGLFLVAANNIIFHEGTDGSTILHSGAPLSWIDAAKASKLKNQTANQTQVFQTIVTGLPNDDEKAAKVSPLITSAVQDAVCEYIGLNEKCSAVTVAITIEKTDYAYSTDDAATTTTKRSNDTEGSNDIEKAFDVLYKTNGWQGGAGGGSGRGSEVGAAQGIAQKIKDEFVNKGYTIFMDVPCGAMLWQAPLLQEIWLQNKNFRYVGVDISDTALDRARGRFPADEVKANLNRLEVLNDPRVTLIKADISDPTFPDTLIKGSPGVWWLWKGFHANARCAYAFAFGQRLPVF